MFSFFTFGQEPSDSLITESSPDSASAEDSIDIKELLSEQILSARKMMEEQSSIEVIPPLEDELLPEAESELLPSGLKLKVYVILVSSIAAAFYLVWRRKKSSIEKTGKEELKKNILSIRDEKPYKRASDELSVIRARLKENASYLSSKDSELAGAARDLKIAKGELHLAAVLRSHELVQIGNSNRRFK